MNKYFLALAALTAGLLAAGASEASTVLVTGSNRGIGLEFVRQYAERGWAVIATARDPSKAKDLNELAAKHKNITVEKLDVVNEAEIGALAHKYQGKPIDVLINNAAIVGDVQAQTLGGFTLANFQNVMNVNLYGVLAVTQAFRENVIASKEKKIVALSSGIVVLHRSKPSAAFLDSNGYFNLVFYRTAKIALNHAMWGIAEDLKSKGVLVGIIAPGAVNTDMARGFFGEAAMATFVPPAKSAASIIKTIDGLNASNSGVVLDHDGTLLPP